MASVGDFGPMKMTPRKMKILLPVSRANLIGIMKVVHKTKGFLKMAATSTAKTVFRKPLIITLHGYKMSVDVVVTDVKFVLSHMLWPPSENKL